MTRTLSTLQRTAMTWAALSVLGLAPVAADDCFIKEGTEPCAPEQNPSLSCTCEVSWYVFCDPNYRAVFECNAGLPTTKTVNCASQDKLAPAEEGSFIVLVSTICCEVYSCDTGSSTECLNLCTLYNAPCSWSFMTYTTKVVYVLDGECGGGGGPD
jgi:hypothetical protein